MFEREPNHRREGLLPAVSHRIALLLGRDRVLSAEPVTPQTAYIDSFARLSFTDGELCDRLCKEIREIIAADGTTDDLVEAADRYLARDMKPASIEGTFQNAGLPMVYTMDFGTLDR